MQLDKEQIALLSEEFGGFDTNGFLNEIIEWYSEPEATDIERNVLECVVDVFMQYLV